jgi:predicted RNase H-like HicB family nuclease
MAGLASRQADCHPCIVFILVANLLYYKRWERKRDQMKRMAHGYGITIKQDENGIYVACIPALPGCHTEGDTLNEAMRNIKEAIKLYLEHTKAKRISF